MQDLATSNAAAVSLIGWWRDAGVDMLVDEVAVPWLQKAQATPDSKPPTKASQAQPAPSDAPLPESLAALTHWLMTSPDIPDTAPPSRRIAASGAAGAPLMILIDMPEVNDHEAGQLLSGECAKLFENMLAAIGQDRSTVYVAALCPARPVTGRLNDAALARLTEIARQHVAFSVPKRLWLLGSTVSRALLGVDDVASRGNLHDFNHATVNIPTVASFAPRFLLDHPAQKASVWADMQMLIKGM